MLGDRRGKRGHFRLSAASGLRARICSNRHSLGERAPTPAGSMVCRCRSAMPRSSMPASASDGTSSAISSSDWVQIAVVVERVDRIPTSARSLRARLVNDKLVIEMIAQGECFGADKGTVVVLILVAGSAGRRRVIGLPFVARPIRLHHRPIRPASRGARSLFRCGKGGWGRQSVNRVLALENRIGPSASFQFPGSTRLSRAGAGGSIAAAEASA